MPVNKLNPVYRKYICIGSPMFGRVYVAYSQDSVKLYAMPEKQMPLKTVRKSDGLLGIAKYEEECLWDKEIKHMTAEEITEENKFHSS